MKTIANTNNNTLAKKYCRYQYQYFCDNTFTVCYIQQHLLQGSTHPWKYLNFFILDSRPWKYLKIGQVLESHYTQVLESPWIHQVKLCNISSSDKQVFCLKQDLLIIGTFCFYQLKLSRNHRNRYYMLL